MASITSVRRALSEDVHDRAVRYLFSMGLRTALILLIVVVPGPWKWVCAIGAIILPGIAVLVANAGRERPEESAAIADAGPGPLGPDRRLPGSRPLPYDPTTEYLR